MTEATTPKRLMIAGGGTGGHIFPGIAIAEEWCRRGGSVIFVGTKRGQEGTLIPKYGFDLKFLNVGSLKGGGLLTKAKTLAGLPCALSQALKILRLESPDAVLGIGGYASGPLCLAASLKKKNTAITDQNMQPGITNRILGKFVRKVFLSFTGSEKFFAREKCVITGNPVRTQIAPVPYTAPKQNLNIFVFGGSQGAVALNKNFIAAIDILKPLWPRLNIVHQAGKTDFDATQEFYKTRDISAVVQNFFDNMNAIYEKANLVICRSGAGTLTELALSGRPAILVPYPFAADNHQVKNAEVFVQAGAAIMIEQKDLAPQKLADLICGFLVDSNELVKMAAAMKSLARPDAAKMIVDELWGA